MKRLIEFVKATARFHIIARFGQAQLVTGPDGRLELRGGTASDRTEAKEWMSLFMHEAVPRMVEA